MLADLFYWGGGVYWDQWNKKEEYNNHILHF